MEFVKNTFCETSAWLNSLFSAPDSNDNNQANFEGLTHKRGAFFKKQTSFEAKRFSGEGSSVDNPIVINQDTDFLPQSNLNFDSFDPSKICPADSLATDESTLKKQFSNKNNSNNANNSNVSPSRQLFNNRQHHTTQYQAFSQIRHSPFITEASQSSTGASDCIVSQSSTYDNLWFEKSLIRKRRSSKKRHLNYFLSTHNKNIALERSLSDHTIGSSSSSSRSTTQYIPSTTVGDKLYPNRCPLDGNLTHVQRSSILSYLVSNNINSRTNYKPLVNSRLSLRPLHRHHSRVNVGAMYLGPNAGNSKQKKNDEESLSMYVQQQRRSSASNNANNNTHTSNGLSRELNSSSGNGIPTNISLNLHRRDISLHGASASSSLANLATALAKDALSKDCKTQLGNISLNESRLKNNNKVVFDKQSIEIRNHQYMFSMKEYGLSNNGNSSRDNRQNTRGDVFMSANQLPNKSIQSRDHSIQLRDHSNQRNSIGVEINTASGATTAYTEEENSITDSTDFVDDYNDLNNVAYLDSDDEGREGISSSNSDGDGDGLTGDENSKDILTNLEQNNDEYEDSLNVGFSEEYLPTNTKISIEQHLKGTNANLIGDLDSYEAQQQELEMYKTLVDQNQDNYVLENIENLEQGKYSIHEDDILSKLKEWSISVEDEGKSYVTKLTLALLDEVQEVVDMSSSSVVVDNGDKKNWLTIEGKDIHKIVDQYNPACRNWLNDEVVNFYVWLILKRCKDNVETKENYPKIHMFNTFFMSKLEDKYQNVKRWTRRIDIFSLDYVIIPVHVSGNHWCLANINFKRKMIEYYDSLGGSNDFILNLLMEYLKDESLDKKKEPFDVQGWQMKNIKNIPQQMNGSDCGVFMCIMAEHLSRNDFKFKFTQKDIMNVRYRMVYEIVNKKLINDKEFEPIQAD